MHIIPAIDLQAGRCVRLFQGDFEQHTDYGDDPIAVASEYRLLGLKHLHVVDLDGARLGQQQNAALIRRIADQSRLEVQLGGGIRDAETLAGWLDAGVTRCVIGSVAITEPATIRGWMQRFGSERVVAALDVRIDDRGTPWLATHGWTRIAGKTLWDCLDGYRDSGLTRILCTDVGRDGTLAGPSIELYSALRARYPQFRLQASGGIRGIEDLTALRGLGAEAAVAGRALLEGRIGTEEIRTFLHDA